MLNRRPLVLSVDDEPDICAMIKDFLEDTDEYDVITSNDPTQVLSIVQEYRPDVLTMDMRMPGMTGLEVLEQIKSFDKDISVIMVTAVREVSTALEAIHLGAYDYVIKPLSVGEVQVAVGRAMEHRRLVLENRAYQENLEQMVQEKTAHLEQKINELSALNNLFQTHLNQRDEAESNYSFLSDRLDEMARQMQELAEEARGRGPSVPPSA